MFLLIALFIAFNAGANNSYSFMGKQALSAFQCSNLALLSQDNLSDNVKKARRLFQYGYETGKEFIEAISFKKVTSEEYRKHTPMIFLMIMQEGHSADFMLGRLYEWSLSEVSKKNPDTYKDKGLGVSNIFHEKNCSLIGR
jgi:hypothetical protein